MSDAKNKRDDKPPPDIMGWIIFGTPVLMLLWVAGRNYSDRKAAVDVWWREQAAKGDPQRNHRLPWDAFEAGWDARQPEIDALREEIAKANETADELIQEIASRS